MNKQRSPIRFIFKIELIWSENHLCFVSKITLVHVEYEFNNVHRTRVKKIIHDNASNETFKHKKNILRVLFISKHDSYVLISIFGLANCLFVYGYITKVQIHHKFVNRHLSIKIISYRESKFWGKNSKEIFFFFLIDIFLQI